MKIEIKNCNNIYKGTIEISERYLNIKCAMNEIGKSTIGKAIDRANNQEQLKHVTSFIYTTQQTISCF
jgi:hypothetical protein